jgi:hypothetical protein
LEKEWDIKIGSAFPLRQQTFTFLINREGERERGREGERERGRESNFGEQGWAKAEPLTGRFHQAGFLKVLD